MLEKWNSLAILTKNSDEVAELLQSNQSREFPFLLDLEDLFYPVPHDALFESVRARIDEHGIVDFQDSIGMHTDNFLTLREFCLYLCVV